MQNETEILTDTLPSENEEEDLEDSEDDWKPSENKGGSGKVTRTSSRGGAKRKSTVRKAKKSSAKRAKRDQSEEEENEEDEFDEDDEELDEEEEDSNDGSKNTTPAKTINSKAFPDKDGKFDLYIFKSDLSQDFKNNKKLCMWRRDGSSLLQKYLRAQYEDNAEDIFIKSSFVYSCWEAKGKHDFLEIKVQCVGDKKDGLVKVLNIEELTKFTMEHCPVTYTGINEEDPPSDENEDEEDELEDEEDEEDEPEDEE